MLTGDVRQVLPSLPSESVHCVVTSPPYYGLRDYGTAQWAGGDVECDHLGEPMRTRAYVNVNTGVGIDRKNAEGRQPFKASCGKCGATRLDSQLGLEVTPAEYIASLVAVFREVRRVLRSDGTLWLNIGDSYAGSGKGPSNSLQAEASQLSKQTTNNGSLASVLVHKTWPGIKPKDLIGIPWMLAFALRDDGWYLRSDIIWSKPNPMPESVTDRPTKAHEYLFLLTKSARYFYDADAIREPQEYNGSKGTTNIHGAEILSANATKPQTGLMIFQPDGGRNKRSVWEIATEPYPEAHFATYPTALVEPCIKAGTSERGVCSACGAPWVRVVKRAVNPYPGSSHDHTADLVGPGAQRHVSGEPSGTIMWRRWRDKQGDTTTGWQASCAHADADVVPATVLDPFAGAGTTCLVADRLGRHAIGIELSPTYASLATRRLIDDCPLFTQLALDVPG